YFAKNGADVTTFASMIARAETGRKKIITVARGYHGTAPWTQSYGHNGIIEEDRQNVIVVNWNDYEQLEKVVNDNPGQIAGFMSTPYDHGVYGDNNLPADGYWQKVEALCKKNGIVLIVDDVRCGFRLDLGGSNEYFGFKPDLICFCKAIGNGYPLSALVGTEALKTTTSKVFYTGSYWFSAAPMAASLACLKEMKKINAPKVMQKQGQKLLDGLVKAAKSYEFDLQVSGVPSMPYLRLADDDSLMLHEEWCGECTKRGALFTSHHNWFLSTAHTDADIKKTLAIADEAFQVVKKKIG
ncbi:MAG: aminotransferase class III-fold pyridoxal phosphate-dependent enzyme, partial [bacterium]|nr:aminotransferase class III-fold pyridoxal phosphate-dependent enzyme [bacterium]